MGRSAVGSLLVVGALWMGGCEQNNVSFFIAGNVIPEGGDGSFCSLMPGGQLLVRGRFNTEVELGAPYEVYPLYMNQIVQRPGPVASDPNGVHVERAEVQLVDEAGNSLDLGGLPNPFSTATSTFVPSAQDMTSPGQQVGAVTGIPAAYRAALPTAGTLLLRLKVFGETNGDMDVETEEWLWPIDLCGGNCLFVCPTEAGDLAACDPGQDAPVAAECACSPVGSGADCPTVFSAG